MPDSPTDGWFPSRNEEKKAEREMGEHKKRKIVFDESKPEQTMTDCVYTRDAPCCTELMSFPRFKIPSESRPSILVMMLLIINYK